MKRKYIYLFALLSSFAFTSCEKNAIQSIDNPPSGAKIKFFNFSVGSPVVNFYANDTKVTAASSATGIESGTGGVAYGSAGPSSNYAQISVGTYTLKGVRPSTALVDPNAIVSTLSAALAEGKYYSFYQAGIYNTATKSSDAFILEDNIPELDTTAAYVRFVHGVSNATAMNFIVFNTVSSTESTVADNIVYKSGSAFVKIPQGIYNLYGRYPATPLVNTVSRANVSFLRGRVYTLTSRGNISAAAFDNTPNR
jgi:hypothetical protein